MAKVSKQHNQQQPARHDGRAKPRPGIEEQQRMIVDAAVPLFLEQGIRTVSVREICEAADCSRSTFYRSFDDVNALLRHIYSVGIFEPVEQFMLLTFNQSMSTEAFRQALDAMFEAIFEHKDYAELVFREANDPGSPAFELVNEVFDNIVKQMQKLLPVVNGKSSDAVYLKSILIANQWIAFDAIRKGLSSSHKKNAKQAAWRLIQNMF